MYFSLPCIISGSLDNFKPLLLRKMCTQDKNFCTVINFKRLQLLHFWGYTLHLYTILISKPWGFQKYIQLKIFKMRVKTGFVRTGHKLTYTRGIAADSTPSMTTAWQRSLTYDENHSRTTPRAPKVTSNRFKRMEWSNVSKAALRSKRPVSRQPSLVEYQEHSAQQFPCCDPSCTRTGVLPADHCQISVSEVVSRRLSRVFLK